MIFLVQQIVRKSLWVYDITAYQGWVSVETGQDTAQFALQTIRQLRVRMGGGEDSQSRIKRAFDYR